LQSGWQCMSQQSTLTVWEASSKTSCCCRITMASQ
jgi:hypothetical protein